MIDIYYAYARINVPTHINANIYQDKANCHIISKEKKMYKLFLLSLLFFFPFAMRTIEKSSKEKNHQRL